VNIHRSEAEAKFAFMDNLFLNVWPAKPDSINGSERIERVPALSTALKQCAGLRKRFLRYFTDGVLIGNCLLSEPAPGVRLCAYVLPDSVLALVLNQGAEAELSFRVDLEPWVAGRRAFAMTLVDADGRRLAEGDVAPACTLRTPRLPHLGLAAFELRGR